MPDADSVSSYAAEYSVPDAAAEYPVSDADCVNSFCCYSIQ